jgi:hypothetical protein
LKRKARWLAVLTLVLLGVFVGVFVWLWPRFTQSNPSNSSNSPVLLSRMDWQAAFKQTATAALRPPALPVASAPIAVSGAQPPAPQQGSGLASKPQPGVWDLCGLGRVPQPAGGNPESQQWPPFPAPIGAEPAARAAQRAFEVLSRGSPRQQAAAHLAQWIYDSDDKSRLAAREKLHGLALASSDAVIARWAAQSCSRPKSACPSEVLARWAAVEPNNLAAHFFWAATDDKGRAPLWAALAAATRYSEHEWKLAATWRDAVPADVPAYVRQLVVIEFIGIEAAFPYPHLQVSAQVCPDGLKPGEPRHTVCLDLANNLLGNSESLWGTGLGLRLIKRLAAPAERIAREAQAQEELSREIPMPSDEKLFSCEGIQSSDRFLTLRAEQGDVAALRQLARERKAASAPVTR